MGADGGIIATISLSLPGLGWFNGEYYGFTDR